MVGDQAGLFGHGTSGEGCDVTDLTLPGVQQELLQALADTGTPVVAVLVTGRPYALGEVADRLAAVVQAFFPGEEGGHAIAGVLTGRVTPSGKLPVEIPRLPGAQPSTYLRSPNAALHAGSDVDPTPLFAFGHGLSYTTFGYADLELSADHTPTDGGVGISCTVRNTGSVAGTEVVQLYLGDPVSSVVRPTRWLAGFTRVTLAPGESARVTFRLHADRTAFTGRDGTRIVEPGDDLGRHRGRVGRPAAVRLVHADRPGAGGRGRPGAHHPGLGPAAQRRRRVNGLPLSAERHLSSHLIDHQHLSSQCCRGSRWRTS